MNEERFDDIEVREESLSHYGTPGMKWYVHNDETKRKYGELPGIGRAKKAAADSSESVKPSLAERGIEIIKKRRQEKKDKQAAARQAAIDQENEKKEKERLEAEYQRKYGMSKEKYDALREATLNSHDPRVVAKGMRLLTDEELNDKIRRLEQEGKIKAIAAKARKEEAEARTAELNRKKQTLPYRLGETAAKTVTTSVINTVTKNAIAPITAEVSKSLAKSGTKAIDSLKKHLEEKTPEVKTQVKQTAETVKAEASSAKAELQAKRAESKATSKSSTQSKVESGFGEALYNRMKAEWTKAPNKESIDKDDPSLGLNRNNTPKVNTPKDDKDK